MGTCNNCLHVDACKQWYPPLPDKYHDGCEHFVDKAEYKRIRYGYRYFLQYDVNPEIGNWHCSVCNRILLDQVERERYCPYCGALLDLEE